MTLISHLLLDDDGLYQASVEIDSAHVNTVTGSPGQDDDGRLDRPGTSSDAIVSAGYAIFSTAAGEARSGRLYGFAGARRSSRRVYQSVPDTPRMIGSVTSVRLTN